MKISGKLIHKHTIDNAEAVNAAILERFNAIKGSDAVRQTHFFHGRFENTYIKLEDIPELKPVAEAAVEFAHEILGDEEELRYGFWFNEMGPGCCTSLHNHDELDEKLSGCYYIRVPENSGRFVAIEDEERTLVAPEEGTMLFFSPALMHEVEENESGEVRLSVAFNFGPPEEE